MDSRASSDLEDGDNTLLLEKSAEERERIFAPRPSSRLARSPYAVVVAVLLLLCSTNSLTFYLTHISRPQCQPCQSVGEPPKLAPMLSDLHLETRHVKFDSTFFDPGSRYRGAPSPAVDAAWEYAGANCKTPSVRFSPYLSICLGRRKTLMAIKLTGAIKNHSGLPSHPREPGRTVRPDRRAYPSRRRRRPGPSHRYPSKR